MATGTEENQNILEAESWDSDSAFSDSGSTSSALTESLRSSMFLSVLENGRGYHKYRDGQYFIPEDEREQERLDMQHEIFLRMMDRKLHHAPLPDNAQNVLDIGTGTGIVGLIEEVDIINRGEGPHRHRGVVALLLTFKLYLYIYIYHPIYTYMHLHIYKNTVGDRFCGRTSQHSCTGHRPKSHTTNFCTAKLQIRSRRFRPTMDIYPEIRLYTRAHASGLGQQCRSPISTGL